MRTDRRTDRRTRSSQYFASPTAGEIIMHSLMYIGTRVAFRSSVRRCRRAARVRAACIRDDRRRAPALLRGARTSCRASPDSPCSHDLTRTNTSRSTRCRLAVIIRLCTTPAIYWLCLVMDDSFDRSGVSIYSRWCDEPRRGRSLCDVNALYHLMSLQCIFYSFYFLKTRLTLSQLQPITGHVRN